MESHTKKQSPKTVSEKELRAKRLKSVGSGARTRERAMVIFFSRNVVLWDEEVRGPTWGPEPTRARLGVLARPGGLCPPGATPSDVICIKNSKIFRKNSIKFSKHSENFYFWVIFYCTGNSENTQNMAYLIKTRNKK